MVCFLFLSSARHVVEVRDDLAVDARAHEARAAHQLQKHLLVLALAASTTGAEQQAPRALGHGHDLVDHLADGLRLEVFAVVRAARLADAGVEQAQVVVDLGDRADRRARVVRRRLLLDGDGRRQALRCGGRKRFPTAGHAVDDGQISDPTPNR